MLEYWYLFYLLGPLFHYLQITIVYIPLMRLVHLLTIISICGVPLDRGTTV